MLFANPKRQTALHRTWNPLSLAVHAAAVLSSKQKTQEPCVHSTRMRQSQMAPNLSKTTCDSLCRPRSDTRISARPLCRNFTPRARTHSSTGTSCSAQLVCCGGYGALPTNQLNKTTFMAVGGAFSPPPSVLRIHSCLPCSIASSRKRPCSPPEAMNTVLSRDVQPTQDTMQSTLCFVFTILDFKLLFTLSTRSPFNAEQSFSAPILPPSSSGFHGT